MMIEAKIFGDAAWAYINDGVIEVNLPEWSGRMDKAFAVAELARLKAFVAQVESALVGSPVPTPTDTAPSARAEVVAEAVAEDEASDSPDLTEWEVAEAVAAELLDFSVENNDPEFVRLMDNFNDACYRGDMDGWLEAEEKLKEYGAWVQSVNEREYWRHPSTKPAPTAVDAESTAEDDEKTPVELWEEWYLHDDGEEWEDDWYDASDQNWYYMDAPPPPQPINHAGRRADYKAWRHNAIFFGGNLPYIPCFSLAANIATFEGEVYRLIHPGDFSYNDIPF